MFKIIPLLCSLFLCFTIECTFQDDLSDSIQSTSSKYLTLRHREGKGLGYSQGYTSLDLFLAKALCNDRIIPFVNLKGHVFNNGRFAGNAGIGLRMWDPSDNRIWGMNFFFDSLASSHLSYKQVSFGLEALSNEFEVHINGYLPVGHKKTPIYTLSYDLISGFLAKAREQFAMAGIDVEIGNHFCHLYYLDFYAGIGPYYYTGRSRRTENAFRSTRKEAVGGRLRVTTAFLNLFNLEGLAAYDSRFKWTGQIALSLNIPFGGCDVCSPFECNQRFFQPVVRNEIIVVDRINRFSSNPEILDPERKE